MKFLSIDNDFFPWYGQDGRFRVRNAVNGEWHDDVHGGLVFDWGHSESEFMMGADIWHFRAHAFHTMGLSLEHEYNVRREYGGVGYTTFSNRLLERFSIILPTFVAESHMHAWDTLHTGIPLPVDEIVHFDAHHDLGYGHGRVRDHVNNERLDCGDWLFHALRLKKAERATIVYPNWREEERPGRWIRKYEGRITWTTWDDWLATTEGDEALPAVAFSCRSGAWAPPYLDRKWLEMARRLGDRPPRPIDDRCMTPRRWEFKPQDYDEGVLAVLNRGAR